jgi:hypothetical protein
MSRKSYLWLLTGVYLVWWVLMAIKPLDFSTGCWRTRWS